MSGNKGVISAIHGVVVEAVFSQNVPAIYESLEVLQLNSVGEKVVIEVLQQLEGGVVRGIAMVSTDGLSR